MSIDTHPVFTIPLPILTENSTKAEITDILYKKNIILFKQDIPTFSIPLPKRQLFLNDINCSTILRRRNATVNIN